MYDKTTRSIRIKVEPAFLESRSRPDENLFVWAYTVEIENLGEEVVQLMSRYWRITDGRGGIQEVEGPGVIGEQPVLTPGQCFRYTSGVPLSTPSGIMMGHYKMETDKGQEFDVEIPAFSLDCDYGARKIN